MELVAINKFHHQGKPQGDSNSGAFDSKLDVLKTGPHVIYII